MAPPKPFLVEYAKSGRAACKICKDPITKDALRIAKVVQSRQFDGYMTMWHHYGCLLKKPGVFKTLHDVEGFDNLRWEDQKKLEQYVQDSGGSLEEEEDEEKEEEEEIDEEDKDFAMEYAKSSRSTCKECEEKIQKDEVRVSKLVESDNPAYPGMVPAWRHIKCFLESGMWSKGAKKIPGFRSLSKADRESVEKLGKGEIDEMPPKAEVEETGKKGKGKKRKSKGGDDEGEAEAEEGPKKKSRTRKKKGEDDEDEPEEEPKEAKKRGRKGKKEDDVTEAKKGKGKADGDAGRKGKGKAKESEEETKPSKAAGKVKADPELEKALEKQSRALWEVKDALRKHVSTSELREMLEVNDQSASGSEHELRDRCADGMLFGPLGKCPLCGSHMEYKEGHYCCCGFLSEWTKCTHTTGDAPRLKAQWQLPEDNDNEYLDEWFQKQKKIKQRPARILPPNRGPPPTKKTKTEGSASAAAAPTEQKALANLPLTGMRIAVAGHLKHNQNELKELILKAGGELASRMSRDVTCLVTTPDEAEKEKGNGKVVQARELRVPIVFETFLTDSVEKHQRLDLKEYMIENKGVSTVKVKGRSAVHEASGLQETGHILEAGKSIYNTTLNMSDMASGINSYYILQLIEEDKSKAVHVFRKWGRVGNERIGSQKLERLPKAEAVEQFKRLFREKTGNDWEAWEAKQDLHKVPGKFYPLDIDYGVDEGRGAGPSAAPGSRSKLDPRVVSLLKMLFDLETYRATMLEFEINLAEMPLGKLTKKQITKCFEVLSSIQNLLQDSSAEPDRRAALLLDASNRFYTLVPAMHPNPINDEGRLKEKIRMLEALRDIEIASRLIGDLSGQGDEEDPLDAHYRQLHCDVEPLPRDHPHWGLVQDYLHKTHAPTHKEWDLELEDVFCVDRAGEGAAYAPFKSGLPNRQLLWHGSRTSNYVGILSQGLRIAPPEAPVTGYMFGKGIYFADLVSKSAQYCYTSRGSPVGLMLLCEVALGDMHELRKAQYMDKAPRGKHSTKGLGKMVPDESELRKLDDDVTVPAGKPVPSSVRTTELMYNEYIVYDTSQVRMRFLLKVRFKHK